ncbi:hypothetical protein K437DRAFT_166852 [Tilletiaria anomala UBC 951]|uniref:Uncharacterized protein n=1 Tax=Tilletiaria anomala (strain ATCC 24038 / CBS 436.72 / UBC 951) TaxID=1037660 RepID=A0A066VJZ6_TILAU|nr:uncharacterized protein K437DRAFT_166852 [Tilletiaria anomala UBC 951]KDN42062.1 hypothetical protein K437DRAFT_166852 [Tilletiaria anomala UBC 951]
MGSTAGAPGPKNTNIAACAVRSPDSLAQRSLVRLTNLPTQILGTFHGRTLSIRFLEFLQQATVFLHTIPYHTILSYPIPYTQPAIRRSTCHIKGSLSREGHCILPKPEPIKATTRRRTVLNWRWWNGCLLYIDMHRYDMSWYQTMLEAR